MPDKNQSRETEQLYCHDGNPHMFVERECGKCHTILCWACAGHDHDPAQRALYCPKCNHNTYLDHS